MSLETLLTFFGVQGSRGRARAALTLAKSLLPGTLAPSSPEISPARVETSSNYVETTGLEPRGQTRRAHGTARHRRYRSSYSIPCLSSSSISSSLNDTRRWWLSWFWMYRCTLAT